MVPQEYLSVQTLRPDGKKGVTLLKSQYDVICMFILAAVQSAENVTLNDILERAQKELSDSIDSDIAWYVLQIKLDLEARALIKSTSPVYQKRTFFIKLTRLGQRKLRDSSISFF